MTEFLFDTRAGLMLFGVIVLVVLLILSWFISLPFDRWLLGRRLATRTTEAYHPGQVDLPSQLESGHNAFHDRGFEPAGTIQTSDGSVHAFLLGNEGRIIGELAMSKSSKGAGRIDLELTSSLAGHRGLLTTSTSGLGLHLWDAELRQVFPGATVADLDRYHQGALEWLAGHGLTADALGAEEILERRADFLRRSNEATARSPSRAVRAESIRAAQGRHAFVGSLSEDQQISERLKRFWRAVGEG